MVGGGAAEAFDAVVGEPRRRQGVLIHADPEALRLDAAALVALELHPHVTPPAGQSRAPAAQGDLAGYFDRFQHVDHGAQHDPVRMDLRQPGIGQMQGAGLLDVARDAVNRSLRCSSMSDVASRQPVWKT